MQRRLGVQDIRGTFGTANDFCEKIWDHSFEVVADDKPCMRFAQGQTSGNAEVARKRAEMIVNEAAFSWQPRVLIFVTVVTIFVM